MELNSISLRWNVVYTRPRSEKKVASSISKIGMESFLPLQTTVRQWSDRKKKIDVPLFPNYVFIRLDPAKREHLYSIKELVRFVSIEKVPVVVRDEEICAIKKLLRYNVEVFSEDYFQQGMKVKIKHGALQGFEGVIIKKFGCSRLLVKIDCMMKAYSFNISAHLAEIVEVEHLTIEPHRPNPLDTAIPA